MVNEYDPGGNALIPIVAVQLLTAFNSPWPISIYLAGFLLLMVACVAATPETAHVDLARVRSGELRAKGA